MNRGHEAIPEIATPRQVGARNDVKIQLTPLYKPNILLRVSKPRMRAPIAFSRGLKA